jgi:hypothetical protein
MLDPRRYFPSGDWVKKDHPFKGLLGPEFSEVERKALVEYLKSL